jgi:hypothetical protein
MRTPTLFDYAAANPPTIARAASDRSTPVMGGLNLKRLGAASSGEQRQGGRAINSEGE